MYNELGPRFDGRALGTSSKTIQIRILELYFASLHDTVYYAVLSVTISQMKATESSSTLSWCCFYTVQRCSEVFVCW